MEKDEPRRSSRRRPPARRRARSREARPRSASPSFSTRRLLQAKGREPRTSESPERVRINDDVEFARDDYDGRIKRCEERIKAGYLKETFEERLKALKAAKELKPAVMKQFPGKSWGVIQRMQELRIVEVHLKEIKDPLKELPNVEAVLAAYEAGTLAWDGNATYWCQGKIIDGPAPFSFERFSELNTEENRGDGGFWVEGGFPLSPKQALCKYIAPLPIDEWDMRVEYLLRLDASVGVDAGARFDSYGNPFPETQLELLDDTGSQDMAIYNDDMKLLMGGDAQLSRAPLKHLMGYQPYAGSAGIMFVCKIIAVQVTMSGLDDNGNPSLMVPWTTVKCSVFDQDSTSRGGPPDRLSGSFLRKMLYCATAPKPRPQLFVGSTKKDLMAAHMLPNIKIEDRTPPAFRRPGFGALWYQEPLTGIPYPLPATHYGMIPPGGRRAPPRPGPAPPGPGPAPPAGGPIMPVGGAAPGPIPFGGAAPGATGFVPGWVPGGAPPAGAAPGPAPFGGGAAPGPAAPGPAPGPVPFGGAAPGATGFVPGWVPGGAPPAGAAPGPAPFGGGAAPGPAAPGPAPPGPPATGPPATGPPATGP